jgi:glutaryl-CoA dehydrogenase
MMAATTQAKPRAERKPQPAPNSDFYQLAETLKLDELALVKQVRAFMETKVAPIITKYWAEDSSHAIDNLDREGSREPGSNA